jgi:hypothetical protein
MARPKSLRLLAMEARIRLTLDEHLDNLDLASRDGKTAVREVHRPQRLERLESERAFAFTAWRELSHYFADGRDVDPQGIRPRLELIEAQTWQARLFRLATLTWSVPVSRGYGRRMRFLVWDDQNGKLIGLIGLTDPVFNLRARDSYVGWSGTQRRSRLVHVMDAFVLGALPPYNMLLGGKLVACLLKTKEVRDAFARRYRRRSGRISKRKKHARLVMVTTSSALGRSSVYNRLKLRGVPFFFSVGYTLGWGHFHVSEALFTLMRSYLRRRRHEYAQNHQYGDGPNWRMRVIRQTLVKLGLSASLLRHGIQREVFVCELATNAKAVLRGTARIPRYSGLLTVSDVAEMARDRWMVPRATRQPEFRNWRSIDLVRAIVPTHALETHTGTDDVAAS